MRVREREVEREKRNDGKRVCERLRERGWDLTRQKKEMGTLRYGKRVSYIQT